MAKRIGNQRSKGHTKLIVVRLVEVILESFSRGQRICFKYIIPRYSIRISPKVGDPAGMQAQSIDMGPAPIFCEEDIQEIYLDGRPSRSQTTMPELTVPGIAGTDQVYCYAVNPRDKGRVDGSNSYCQQQR